VASVLATQSVTDDGNRLNTPICGHLQAILDEQWVSPQESRIGPAGSKQGADTLGQICVAE